MKKVKEQSNYEFFLELDTASYKGKWIAIAANKVVAAANKASDAFKKAKKKYPQSKISLAKVPQQEALVLKIKIG